MKSKAAEQGNLTCSSNEQEWQLSPNLSASSLLRRELLDRNISQLDSLAWKVVLVFSLLPSVCMHVSAMQRGPSWLYTLGILSVMLFSVSNGCF